MDEANRALQSFRSGTCSYGTWQLLPGTNIARLLARAGCDWVMVDCEHGNIDDSAMHESVTAIAASSVSPLVRIPDNQAWMVKRALDSGAHGILVPLLRSVADAEAVVKASKFPPLGFRGFGSPFATQTFQPSLTPAEYLSQANMSLITMVQIETQEALDAVYCIATTPGIDVLFVGPYDLGNSIGYPVVSSQKHASLEAAIARVLDAATAAGKIAGIFCSSGEEAMKYKQMGFRMINVTTDVACLQGGSMEELRKAKGELLRSPTQKSPYG